MPTFPQNKNFRERSDCAVFLHGFNVNVNNWDTYREQCYQELKNRYKVYISKFDIGRYSESAYVHLKNPQDVHKLRNMDPYEDPKTGEMLSRLKLGGGNIIVYPYCKDRNPNAKITKERAPSVCSYRSDYSAKSGRSSRASNQSGQGPSRGAYYRGRNTRDTSRDNCSVTSSNRSSPISVNDAMPRRDRNNNTRSSYGSTSQIDWSETEDNDYDDEDFSPNSPHRQDTVTERMQNMNLGAPETNRQDTVKAVAVDSNITVKASQSDIEYNREDTVKPGTTQETVENNGLILPNLSDAASLHSIEDDYLLPEQNQNNYQSTSRSRAVSVAAQSDYFTENEDFDETDEVSFEKQFQAELKHNLPDVFWQLAVKDKYIETLRNVYRNSKSEFLQTIIQYSKELNELHDKLKLQQQVEQQQLLDRHQMANQTYFQALQNTMSQMNWNDSDMSSLLHYYSNRLPTQQVAPQRSPNMASISSDFGINSTPHTPMEVTPNFVQNQLFPQNLYNNVYSSNGLVGQNNYLSHQDNLAAAQMVTQIGQKSTLSSPINTPVQNAAFTPNNLIQDNQQNSQASPIVPNQPNSSSVYNVTNNYYAPSTNAPGYEQNQLVKQPSA